MKSLIVTGPAQIADLKFQESVLPEMNPDQVEVRVLATGVNPIDWMVPVYDMFGMLNLQTPYTMGSDLSGVIERVGKDVVDFKVGDEVFGAFELKKQGSFAASAVIDQSLIALKPAKLSHEQAAGVPLAAQTAMESLEEYLKIKSGEKILIQAAAGGVGIFAVQLAKLIGAYVVAVASDKNEQFLIDLGADEVFNYKKDFSTLPADFDAVLDSKDSSEQTIRLLKRGGRYVSLTTPAAQELASAYGISAANFLYTPNASRLKRIAILLEAEKLKVFIDKVFSLDDALIALEYQKEGHSRGKNVLIP